ncbi:MAG: hypothetical protein COS39_10935 [Hydrogenophilales bacterium CG03_land_8_20_14_0_80_62_28]|nr:DOMON-like domain-containing protein [Betaproteobacteria bacterium]OIO79243.1 MAG: hypothetical protein AUJ86_02200 [Hydrogenophilaceae bacterium CG1_02_62_390]PIV21446.1 MAG: hypothetical protein COS39_10935 [Hydrogenophilales bacterium CG03_land_8_20_14_0_80_62_28]PIW39555.1 MAG: hypothetical protein COW23_00845 [Hydrogenophilales bacterium CG15_BIG_FIL_POST_REV_8_21_14_020_62_31]PIW71016.1 MAG: hypothetical protein COW07_10325 [Hydrogenophilales bacterium CG12_big_fil_rev_8_21_14_0_65_61_
MRHASLIPHPAGPCPNLLGIDVRVAVQPGGELALTYTLSGAVSGLVIPGPTTPDRRDALWRHTCFEAFIMAGDGPGYREFNFSPSGEWAAYAFQGYRDGSPLEPAPKPTLVCRAGDSALELEARLTRAVLPPGARLHLGLSAVLEHTNGTLSYWALRHPVDKPDFHHTGGFVLELERA